MPVKTFYPLKCTNTSENFGPLELGQSKNNDLTLQTMPRIQPALKTDLLRVTVKAYHQNTQNLIDNNILQPQIQMANVYFIIYGLVILLINIKHTCTIFGN